MEKGFTVRELTVRGWERREDLDFRDDGTKFKALQYKNGLIATYAKAEGEYYLTLRIDYLNDLVFEEYSKMDSYKLADEFNGVTEIDADKVCQNAEEIMEEYLILKEEVEKQEVDLNRIFTQVKKEKSLVDRVLAESNITIDELSSISSYDLKNLKDYRSSIERDIDRVISNLADKVYCHRDLRKMIYKLDSCGYLVINGNGFYINSIREIIQKAKVGC